MADLPRSSPARATLASQSEDEERVWRAVEGASVEWKLQFHGRATWDLYRACAGRGGGGREEVAQRAAAVISIQNLRHAQITMTFIFR